MSVARGRGEYQAQGNEIGSTVHSSIHMEVEGSYNHALRDEGTVLLMISESNMNCPLALTYLASSLAPLALPHLFQILWSLCWSSNALGASTSSLCPGCCLCWPTLFPDALRQTPSPPSLLKSHFNEFTFVTLFNM